MEKEELYELLYNALKQNNLIADIETSNYNFLSVTCKNNSKFYVSVTTEQYILNNVLDIIIPDENQVKEIIRDNFITIVTDIILQNLKNKGIISDSEAFKYMKLLLQP